MSIAKIFKAKYEVRLQFQEELAKLRTVALSNECKCIVKYKVTSTVSLLGF